MPRRLLTVSTAHATRSDVYSLMTKGAVTHTYSPVLADNEA
jgi:hypothetical protein